jgi:hypothetical protein
MKYNFKQIRLNVKRYFRFYKDKNKYINNVLIAFVSMIPLILGGLLLDILGRKVAIGIMLDSK